MWELNPKVFDIAIMLTSSLILSADLCVIAKNNTESLSPQICQEVIFQQKTLNCEGERGPLFISSMTMLETAI